MRGSFPCSSPAVRIRKSFKIVSYKMIMFSLPSTFRHAEGTRRKLPEPSIRLSLNCSMTDAELDHICEVLEEVGKTMAEES